MVITGAKGDCKRKSYPYTYKEDDTDGTCTKNTKATCTKTIHLPVSKVFISMTGYRGSRERGKRDQDKEIG